MPEKNIDLQAAIDRIYAAQDQKNSKLDALTAELDRVQAQIAADEAALSDADLDFSQGTEDLVAQVSGQQDARQRIAENKERVQILQGQIEYTRDNQNFLEFSEYDTLINTLQDGYDKLLQDELTQAQELADAMTDCGERIHGNRKELQAAALAAFNMYHGFTRFRKKTEHRCVATESKMDPETKKIRPHNIFKDFIVDDNARIRPTVGTDQDVADIAAVSRRFNTRGGRWWWNT